MFDSIDLGGKGFLGILALMSIVFFILYAMSFAVVPDGFGYFLGAGVLALIVFIIAGFFGYGGGNLIAKFR